MNPKPNDTVIKSLFTKKHTKGRFQNKDLAGHYRIVADKKRKARNQKYKMRKHNERWQELRDQGYIGRKITQMLTS